VFVCACGAQGTEGSPDGSGAVSEPKANATEEDGAEPEGNEEESVSTDDADSGESPDDGASKDDADSGGSADDGASKDDADSGESADDGASKDDAASDAEPIEFVIPVSPVDQGAIVLYANEDGAPSNLVPAEDPIVRLAFGEGYPNLMHFQLDSLLLVSGGELLISTSLTVESVVSDGDGIAVSLLGDGLELEALRAGSYRLALDVTAEFDDGVTKRIAAGVQLQVLEVAGVSWSTCTGPLYVVSGSPLSSSRLYPLDADGAVFEPHNAAFDQGAELIVEALAETRIEAPAGVDSLVVTGPSQTVEVRSRFGPVASLQLIQPEDVDGIEPTFMSSEGGARGGSTAVRHGGELALDLSKLPFVSVHPGARFGGMGLCGGPDPALFQLRSTTPEVCTIEENGCATRGCLTSGYVPTIANVIAEGTCNLELDAPTLDHGRGLSQSFSTTFKALSSETSTGTGR
jgi:hypothetical protein